MTVQDRLMDETETFEIMLTVLDDYGLHARPAASLARTAQNFRSEIRLSAGACSADAKSILDILSLAADRNTELKLFCRGEDALAAGAALSALFKNNFVQE